MASSTDNCGCHDQKRFELYLDASCPRGTVRSRCEEQGGPHFSPGC